MFVDSQVKIVVTTVLMLLVLVLIATVLMLLALAALEIVGHGRVNVLDMESVVPLSDFGSEIVPVDTEQGVVVHIGEGLMNTASVLQ